MPFLRMIGAQLTCLSITLCLAGMSGAGETGRCALWVDVYAGEPVSLEMLLDDFAEVRVVYVGEAHTVARHHEIQESILRGLADRGRPLVLGLEQLERFQQPLLDRYCRGEIDFEKLAELTDWGNRWSNYRQYRPVLEAARELKAPILALNARTETIREVFRKGGVARLDEEARKELPDELLLEDPPYERLLNLQLMVHMAVDDERLRPMREAQICRDETMAATLVDFLKSDRGRGRTAVVLCGTGHIAYGYGMVARVRRRLPEATDRLLVLSQSGDVELSQEELAATREIEITHQQLRQTGRPIADYLNVAAPRKPDDSK